MVTSSDFPELEKEVVVRDVIHLDGKNKLLLRMISKNSPLPQGVVLEFLGDRGTLTINEQPGKRFVIWEKYGLKEIEITSDSCEGAVGVYNISEDEKGQLNSLAYGSGMIIEELDNGKRIYHCNDYGVDDARFDKFVFSIETHPSVIVGGGLDSAQTGDEV